jgi:catalase
MKKPQTKSHSPVSASSAGHSMPSIVTKTGSGGETQQLAAGSHPVLTTNHGLALSDNQNSTKAYTRGPSLLEDHIFLNKITHFDRERIPERVVHARASAAHGIFELTHSLASYTTAQVLTEVGKKIPCFARLSTVVGGPGSADTVRDVRGFAVKFYTDQGNWDLVGNEVSGFGACGQTRAGPGFSVSR